MKIQLVLIYIAHMVVGESEQDTGGYQIRLNELLAR